MQEIIENTQNQKLTSSETGRNVTPLLVANSHFFLESGSFGQLESQKFGVVSENEFRTTTKITYTGKLYAICQGQIFIQPQTGNPNKVNLLLRPYKQPIKEVPIKYFIYRGLNKSDFFTEENNETVLINEDGSSSEFIKHVWSEFNSFYNQLDESEKPADFKASTIGFFDDVTTATETLIDEYLYKVSTFTNDVEDEATQFELPMVSRGTHLGSVDGEIGLDIVLKQGEYTTENATNSFQLDLAFARAEEGKIDTSSITGIENAALYQKRCIKEACVNFIDPAAFYGLHCNGVGKLFVGDKVAATLKTSKEDIYPLISSFVTSTTQYVHIQSNRQRSYNFYGNYVYSLENANTLKWDTDPTVMANEVEFGTLGWPVHLFSNEEKIYIQLTTDSYENAALYAHLGNITTANEQNFVRNTNLLQKVSEDEQNPVDLNYTKPIGFTNVKEGTNSIATIIHLIYEGKRAFVTNVSDAEDTYSLDYLNSLFGLVSTSSKFQNQNTGGNSVIIGDKLQLFQNANYSNKKNISVVKSKKVNDKIKHTTEENYLKRVTYETEMHFSCNNSSLYLKKSPITNSGVSGGVFNFQEDGFYKPKSPFKIDTINFSENNSIINGLILFHEYGDNVIYKRLVGIADIEENEVIKSLIATHNLANSYLFLESFLNFEESYTSYEGYSFKKFRLGVSGELPTGELVYAFPENEIVIYTLDDNIYFSELYSKNVVVQSQNTNILLTNTIEE